MLRQILLKLTGVFMDTPGRAQHIILSCGGDVYFIAIRMLINMVICKVLENSLEICCLTDVACGPDAIYCECAAGSVIFCAIWSRQSRISVATGTEQHLCPIAHHPK